VNLFTLNQWPGFTRASTAATRCSAWSAKASRSEAEPIRRIATCGAWARGSPFVHIVCRCHRVEQIERRRGPVKAHQAPSAAQTSEVRVEATIRAVKLEPLSPRSAIAAKLLFSAATPGSSAG
jgi:hypothetical protein